MTDIQAAVGPRAAEAPAGDRRHAPRDSPRATASCCATTSGSTLPVEPECARTNWQSYSRAPARRIATSATSCRPCSTPASPRAAASCARTAKMATRHAARRRCRNSEVAQDRRIVLPLYPQMTDAEQDARRANAEDGVCAAMTHAAEAGRPSKRRSRQVTITARPRAASISTSARCGATASCCSCSCCAT